jgi:predicted unusual protein kinase regulating ubiquinone biosynthesis (AarF/ABC1/UbiB family)
MITEILIFVLYMKNITCNQSFFLLHFEVVLEKTQKILINSTNINVLFFVFVDFIPANANNHKISSPALNTTSLHSNDCIQKVATILLPILNMISISSQYLTTRPSRQKSRIFYKTVSKNIKSKKNLLVSKKCSAIYCHYWRNQNYVIFLLLKYKWYYILINCNLCYL